MAQEPGWHGDSASTADEIAAADGTLSRPQGSWRKIAHIVVLALPSLLIANGLFLRVFQYSFDRSLFLDEAFVAKNVVDRSYGELLRELEFDQRAPAGFLLVEKLATEFLGDSDLSLRLFPLLCGLASVFLFWALARRCLPRWGAVVALALFVFSPSLIYYASELKQYGPEALVTILLLLAAERCASGPLTWRGTLQLGMAGAVGVWFSLPAPFVLAALGCCLAVRGDRRGAGQRLPRLAVAGALWLASFAALYAVQLRHFPDNQGLKGLWEFGFMPLPPRSLRDCTWLFARLLSALKGPTGLFFVGIAGFAFVAGVHALYKTNRLRLAFLIGPVLVAVAVSGLRIYPFHGRVLLYLAPIFLLIVGLGTAQIGEALRSLPLARVAFLCLMILPTLGLAANQTLGRRPYCNWAFGNHPLEEVKPLLGYLKAHWQYNDVVYLYSQSAVAFNHYARRYGFEPEDAIPGMLAEVFLRDWSKVPKDLEKLRGRERVWVLFSHVYTEGGVDEEKLYLYFLDSMGRRLDYQRPFADCNASLYLYDLSAPAADPRKREGAPPPAQTVVRATWHN